jgi:hypothetical protein
MLNGMSYRETGRDYSILANATPFRPFDFAVIRYIWTVGSGTDLDTRTAFLDLDPEYDLIDVGWSRADVIGPNSPYYLQWGGDNQDPVGQEAVLVDFDRMKEDYPSALEVSIRMRAFWFTSRDSGRITVQFETFVGGTMEQVGTDFVNVGGERIQTLEYSASPTATDNTDLDGDEIGTLTYDFDTRRAAFSADAAASGGSGATTSSNRRGIQAFSYRYRGFDYSALQAVPPGPIPIRWSLYEPLLTVYTDDFISASGWSLYPPPPSITRYKEDFSTPFGWSLYQSENIATYFEDFSTDVGWSLYQSEMVGDYIEDLSTDEGWSLYEDTLTVYTEGFDTDEGWTLEAA